MTSELVLERSKTLPFAITIRRTAKNKPIDEALYTAFVSYLEERLGCEFQYLSFEKEAGLHLHAVVNVPKIIPLKRFRVRGWHVHMVEIHNEEGWLRYIRKYNNVDPLPLPEDFESYSEEGEHIEIPKRKLFSPNILECKPKV